MEIKTTRKCKVCKNLITLEYDKFTLYKEAYYHNDCFIENVNDKRNKKLTQDEILIMMDMLQEKNKDKIKDVIDKNHLFKYLQRRYELVYMPTFIFVKFDQVFNGTYKNLSEPVSPEDLLDMWERKETYLDRMNQWKIGRGEGIDDGVNRMWYDLATLMSRVSSYKKWKMSQEINVCTKENIIEEKKSKIDYSKLYNVKKKEKNNMEDIFEEI
jgi:hypothetical protein